MSDDVLRVHPRDLITATAKKELGAFLLDWSLKHELTIAEQVQLLLLELASTVKYCIRSERDHTKGRKK